MSTVGLFFRERADVDAGVVTRCWPIEALMFEQEASASLS